MLVHHHEAGQQRFALRIDLHGVGGNLHPLRIAERDDAALVDDQRLLAPSLRHDER